MNKKQLIVACVIISILLSGCNPYRFVKIEKVSEVKPGYYVSRRSTFIDELVIDEKGNHPQDLSIAEQRFKRRRKTVENWYKRYYPDFLEGSPIITSVKSFFSIFFLPLIWVGLSIYEPSEKGFEKQRKKYQNAEEKMLRYIQEDCRKENLIKK